MLRCGWWVDGGKCEEELLRGDSERAAHMAAHVAGGRAGRRSAAVLAESALCTLLPPTIIAAIPETYKKR